MQNVGLTVSVLRNTMIRLRKAVIIGSVVENRQIKEPVSVWSSALVRRPFISRIRRRLKFRQPMNFSKLNLVLESSDGITVDGQEKAIDSNSASFKCAYKSDIANA